MLLLDEAEPFDDCKRPRQQESWDTIATNLLDWRPSLLGWRPFLVVGGHGH